MCKKTTILGLTTSQKQEYNDFLTGKTEYPSEITSSILLYCFKSKSEDEKVFIFISYNNDIVFMNDKKDSVFCCEKCFLMSKNSNYQEWRETLQSNILIGEQQPTCDVGYIPGTAVHEPELYNQGFNQVSDCGIQ